MRRVRAVSAASDLAGVVCGARPVLALDAFVKSYDDFP